MNNRAVPPPKTAHPIVENTETTITDNQTGEVLSQESDSKCIPSEGIVNPGVIGVALSATKNLGEYESAKVYVSISWPCVATPEAREETYQMCAAWADEKIMIEVGKV